MRAVMIATTSSPGSTNTTVNLTPPVMCCGLKPSKPENHTGLEHTAADSWSNNYTVFINCFIFIN